MNFIDFIRHFPPTLIYSASLFYRLFLKIIMSDQANRAIPITFFIIKSLAERNEAYRRVVHFFTPTQQQSVENEHKIRIRKVFREVTVAAFNGLYSLHHGILSFFLSARSLK